MKEKQSKSLSIHLPLLFVISVIIIMAVVLPLVHQRFHDRMIDQYTRMAKGVTQLMVNAFDGDRVDEFIVISNHRFAHHFKNWAASRRDAGRPGKITVLDDGTSTNETRLGAVKDMAFAVDELHLDDDLLVIAGDNVLDFSLKGFVDYALRKGTSCTMRYLEEDEARLRKSGVSEVGEGEVLLSLEEKPENPKSHWCTPPFYYYRREDAARLHEAIADGCGTDAPGSLVAWMCAHTVLHSWEMPGNRYDIGSLESYRKVQETYRGIVR